MVQSDPIAVAVSTSGDDGHGMVGEPGASGEGQGPAVQRVHPVGAEEARQVRGAADPGDNQYLVRLEPHLGTGLEQRIQDAEVTAARTPIRRDLGLEILHAQSDGFGCHLVSLLELSCPTSRSRPQVRPAHSPLVPVGCSVRQPASVDNTSTISLPARISLTPDTMCFGSNGSPSYFLM